jgi:hypothetical protein
MGFYGFIMILYDFHWMWMWLPWLEMKQLRTVGPFPFRVSASASLVGHVHQIWESKQLFAVAFPANFLH